MSREEKAIELERLTSEGYKTYSPWFDDLRSEFEPPWPHYGNDVY